MTEMLALIDWWGLARNALWIVGFAWALAIVSVASYEAQTQRQRLRTELDKPRQQAALDMSLALFCLGLLVTARRWWEHVVWGFMVALFLTQAVWLRWRLRGEEESAPPLSRSGP